jgi:hypothetical protein
MPAIRGSCLCGSVKFEINGPLTHLLNCHCSKCRKQHGAAFRSRARVRVEDFRWLRGEDLVSYYESSPGFHRGFCSKCGSPIVNRPSANYRLASVRGSDLGVPLGILDDDPGVRPEQHIFVGNRAPWFEITDDLPEYPGYPPAG